MIVEDLGSERPRPVVRAAFGAALALLAAALLAALLLPRGWEVRVLEGGRPCWIGPCGLDAGDALVTGATDAWEVSVADIGVMRLAGNTSVRRLPTDVGHLVRLDAGAIDVAVNAPPRAWRVETPAALVVDPDAPVVEQGCSYDLAVTPDETRLAVRSGTVALENADGVSVVPAGSGGRAVRGEAPAVPIRADASAAFKHAAAVLDDALAAGTPADPLLDALLAAARPEDGLTLWHVLQRVPEDERARVFDGITERVPGAHGTDRAAVLALDTEALRRLWKDLAAVAYSEG